jgi:hypothetical protein
MNSAAPLTAHEDANTCGALESITTKVKPSVALLQASCAVAVIHAGSIANISLPHNITATRVAPSGPDTGLVSGAAQLVMRHLPPDMPGTCPVQPTSYPLLLEADSRRLINIALFNGRCHKVYPGNDTARL